MKNIVLSAVAVLAMSSFAVAGGDIAPVEEPVVVPEPVVTDSGFYIGGAYGYLTNNVDLTGSVQDQNGNFHDASVNLMDDSHSEFMIDAGYKFNQYVAVEGRYWIGVSDDNWLSPAGQNYTGEVDAWGIYVKPMYPVTDAFDIYALLGYADVTYEATHTNASGTTYTETYPDLNGFSWGLGASYSFTDNIGLFIDYTSLYDDSSSRPLAGTNSSITTDNTIQSWNFGVNYQF
jgi:opacity protein-like surface antigen